MARAFGALDPLVALLWEHDRRTAYLLSVAQRRVWAVGSLLPADAGAGLDPAAVGELEQRVNAMDADQTVALALDALDRYLATIDGDGLAPPESAL